MLLTYDDQQFLISKNVISADWIISDILGSEIKDFLITSCGFNETISEIPATVLKSNLSKMGMSGTDYVIDPWVQLKGFVSDFFKNDEVLIPTSPMNISTENELRIRRSIGSKFVAIAETGGVYIQYDNYMRRVGNLTAGGNIYALWCNQFGDEIYVGGTFTEMNGVLCSNIVKITIADLNDPWSVVTTTEMSDGLDDAVYCIKEIGGEIYATGNFLNSGAFPISRVAKWDTGAGEWIEVSTDPINEIVNVISARSTGEIYIGTGDIGSVVTDSKIFVLNAGSWVPLVFPEITADPNGWISNGAIIDIAFNDTNTKMILAGSFTSNCTGNDEDLLIVNLIDLTTMHYGFSSSNSPGNGWITSVKFAPFADDLLSVVGNFNVFSATTFLSVYDCCGLVHLTGFVNNATKSIKRPMTNNQGSLVKGQGTLADGDLKVHYVGEFGKVADNFYDFPGTQPGDFSSSRYMKFHNNGFTLDIGKHINESDSVCNVDADLAFIKVRPFDIAPP